MSTNVRTLSATPDYIELGAGGAVSGWGTYLFVCKRNQTANGDLLAEKLGGAGVADGLEVKITANAANRLRWAGDVNSDTASITLVNADGWCIMAITKATGTVAPRMHKCLLSGPTWTHANGGTNASNQLGAVGWRIGCYYDGASYSNNSFAGDILCVARFNARVLSDAELETAVGLGLIYGLNPTNFWILNQAAVGTSVPDFMGTGANQTNRSGTSVTSGVTIPNFDTANPVASTFVPKVAVY